MALDFIFMLTRNDQTVAQAHDYVDVALEAGVKHIGFKDVGLSQGQLNELANTIRNGGAKTYLELVSLDRDSEMNSAKNAVETGVDYLLGGTHVDGLFPIVQNSPIRCCPFPGRVVGHPSVLEGSISEITESAKQLCEREDVYGLDLLAYRYAGDASDLMSSVCSSVKKPVIVAGSIDRPEQIHAVAAAGGSAITIGTAAIDGKFPGVDSELRSQLAAIKKFTNRE